jgi:hypothetical protein
MDEFIELQLPKNLTTLTLLGEYYNTEMITIDVLHSTKLEHMKIWHSSSDYHPTKLNFIGLGSSLSKFETNCRLMPNFIQTGTFPNAKELVLSWKTTDIFRCEELKPSVTDPGLYYKFSEFKSLQHLCITDFVRTTMLSCKIYYEFFPGNEVRVKLNAKNFDIQIEQIQLGPKKMTKLLLIKQFVHEGPVTLLQIPFHESITEMPTQKLIMADSIMPSTQTEFALSIISFNSQELLNSYSTVIKRLIDESNNLKGLLSSYLAAIQRLINEFNDLSMLLSYPETKQRLINLLVGSFEVILIEYSKGFQLIKQSETLQGLFDSYSTAIEQVTNKSKNLQVLLSNCSTADTLQQINPKNVLQTLLNKYLEAIQSFNNSNSLQILLNDYSNVDQKLKRLPSTIEKIQTFSSVIQPVLVSLNVSCSAVNRQIKLFHDTIEKLFNEYLVALSGKAND